MRRSSWLSVVLLIALVVAGALIFQIAVQPSVSMLPAGAVLPAASSTPGFELATSTPATTTAPIVLIASTSPAGAPLYPYIEVVDSCGPYYDGVCVNLRSGPGTNYPAVLKLRDGIVLPVSAVVSGDDGQQWFKLIPDTEPLRYPERVANDWYVSAQNVQLFYDDGTHLLEKGSATTTKHIVVSLSKEMLWAYDGDSLYMQDPISTGLDETPTPLGTFQVYKMTPSRYMQGPIAGVSDQFYDLPGVPWNLYFTQGGAVIHGAYWHNHFGEPWSHGCINLAPDEAKKLYLWATVGTIVTVEP